MPVDPATLLVDPNEIARKYGLEFPTTEQLDSIGDAISDAQADVEAYLMRPLTSRVVTLTGIHPVIGADLESYKAWPDCYRFDDNVTVLSRAAHPDGTYDVEFKVGLDAAEERPIMRYVTAHALRGLREDEAYGFPLNRVVTSLSADGQSIQFVARPSEDGAAGSLPNMKSLRGYRRLAVFQRGRDHGALWPGR